MNTVSRMILESVPLNYVELSIVMESQMGLNFGDCFAYALAKATGESPSRPNFISEYARGV
jgi:hypothetical protein